MVRKNKPRSRKVTFGRTMEKNKIKICGAANKALMKMSGSTGLTPNILARIGFCLSLRQPTSPEPGQYKEEGDTNFREFNRYTLFGNNSFIYMALLKQKTSHEVINKNSDIDELILAHLNRGAILLSKKRGNIYDLMMNEL
jgi:DNA sulfur modification protein DndE